MANKKQSIILPTNSDSGNNKPSDAPKHQFEANDKYFTISCYVVGVVLITILAARTIMNWEATKDFIGSVLHVIAPYFIGFLVAFLVNPLVNLLYAKVFRDLLKLKSQKLKAGLSVFFAYLLVLGLIGICIIYIVPQLISSISELINQLPIFYNEVIIWFNNLLEKYPDIDPKAIEDITNDYLPHFNEYLAGKLQDAIPLLYGAGVSIVKFFINFVIAIIVSVYMISDKKSVLAYSKKIGYAFLSKEHAEAFFGIVKECNHICKNFFVGKTIDSFIIGCLCFILMSILHLPYAMLISVIVGITNMIPYFGPYIGAVPGVIILLIDKPSHGIIFLLLIIGLQAFDGFLLGPKILGDSTGLRPIMILFAISCGGAIAGPLGMFIGVPVFGIIVYLFDLLVNHKLKSKQIPKQS